MKKRVIIIIALLIAITAAVTSVYVLSRDKVESGSVLIRSASGDVTVRMTDLALSPVKGTITNKNGDTKTIDADGYRLVDIPDLAGVTDYSEIQVYSDDEYNAVITKAEMADRDKAWLITGDEGIRLIVFGDDNAKRDVKNVARIEIR